ncbi:hypothetical protein [Thioclava atlantica]|nr:hypothetical protein [Thioclava atlantica]
MGIARLLFAVAIAVLSAEPAFSSSSDEAIALSGAPRLAVFALSQPERSLRDRWEMRRLLISLAFEGRVLVASRIEAHVSPFIRYDSNLNGGFPVSSLTVGGLTFQINPDDVRKKGALVGLDGQASFAMPLADGLALSGVGQVELGYAPQQRVDKTQLSGSLCVERMFNTATWLSSCLSGYKQVFDLGQDRGISGSLTLRQELLVGQSFHELTIGVSRKRELANGGSNQNIVSLGMISALRTGFALNTNFSFGDAVLGELVMRNRVGIGISGLIAGRPTSVFFHREESRGSLYLGQPRRDRTLTVQMIRSLPWRWSAEISYSLIRSSADVFDDNFLGFSVSRRF